MFKKLFRKLAGQDPETGVYRDLLAQAEGERDRLKAELDETKASLDRHRAELIETAEHEEVLTDQLATYRHLIAALLLRYGETRLGGPILRAAAAVDFEAEHLGEQDCVELKLCD